MRLLVTGAAGMLGHDVARAGEQAGHDLDLRGRDGLDITDPAAVAAAIGKGRPEVIVNCAAWTDVDGAESHPREAHAVNAEGAGNVARAAASAGAKLLHVSTDYVFDGEPRLDRAGRPRPFLESDPTGPRTVYGQSKLAGERLVLAASPEHAVVRSSWLFGVDGKNFVATMLRLAGAGAEAGAGGRDVADGPPHVRVVDDQIGSPTWTGHLAPALIALIEDGVSGLLHLAGGGSVSWNGFAREIFEQAGLECVVEPTSTAALGLPARRPAFSVLGSERADIGGLADWREGLEGYLSARARITSR